MITVDSCSFYILPWSTIIGNMNPIQLKATYYNVTIVTLFVELLNDLIMAKLNTYDVFNTLDIMHNEFFLKDLTTASMLQLNF